MKILVNLILLSRVGMLPLSLSVPIIGALSLRLHLDFLDLIALAGIGIASHFFGFVLNDLMDYALDKNSPFRQRSPLVRGDIKHWQAWLFVIVQIPIAYGLYHGVLDVPLSGFVWLGSSVGLSVVYNLFSKWRWLPRILAEIALGLSVALLGISGAWAFQQTIPADTWLYCGTLGLVLLLVNSVPSGLKDIQFDRMFGARSFVLSTGTTVSIDGVISLSVLLKRYMITLQIVVTVLLVSLAIVYEIGLGAWILLIVLQVYALLHTLRLLNLQHVNEFPDVNLMLGGFYNYFALVIIIWAYLPSLIQIAVALIMMSMLSIPLRRAWAVYRQRDKTIITG